MLITGKLTMQVIKGENMSYDHEMDIFVYLWLGEVIKVIFYVQRNIQQCNYRCYDDKETVSLYLKKKMLTDNIFFTMKVE